MRLRSFLPLVVLCTSVAALQAASPWSARIRATYLQTADKSDAFSALGGNFAADAIKVSERFIPEIDVGYAFTETLSAELVLTIPQQHTVTLAGVGRLGTFKHLPPTLLFQFRARPGASVRPYAGLGVNYTFIWADRLAVAGVPLGLDTHSVGVAAQLGLDWKLDTRWSFNADLKRVALDTGVYAGGTRLTRAQVDPWLYSVGARYDF